MYLLLQALLNQSNNLILVHILDAQKVIVVLRKVRPVALAVHGRRDELHGPLVRGCIRLEVRPGAVELLVYRRLVLLEVVARGPLRVARQVARRQGRVLHVDSAVLRLVWVLEDAHDGLADARQGGGAEDAVAAVPEVNLARLEVEQPAGLDAPVEKGAAQDEGVRHVTASGVGRLALEGVLHGDLVPVDG